MKNNFQFVALDRAFFDPFFEKTDAELAAVSARRMVVDASPGFPCRVSLADAEVGETVILLPFAHLETDSPYRASGPVFVRKTAKTGQFAPNEVPKMLRHRLLSLRGYDENSIMIAASVGEGNDLEMAIDLIFENQNVAFLHVHNARPGCFNCTVRRA